MRLRFPGSVLLVVSLAVARPAQASEQMRLITALRQHPSPKVRLQAAASLARVGDAAAVPALGEALAGGKTPALRAMAAEALGRIGHPSALPYLRSGVRDRDPFVRSRADRALSRLSVPEEPGVMVGRLGDRTGRAPAALVEAMRAQIQDRIRGARGRYTIEGSITSLGRRRRHDGVEVTCEVSLVLVAQPRGTIVGMTSTSATVEYLGGTAATPWERLQREALGRAVGGAYDSLRGYFPAADRPLVARSLR